MAGAIEQIYDQLMQVLGGTNPNQFFCMLLPGTTLNQATYAYTTKIKPALVAEAESRLVDQMFDVAQVTGSSNGQRVSSQYMQALSVLVPKFDPMIPQIRNKLRDYLNSPAPANATVDGKPFSGNLQALYFALYEEWLKQKSTWETSVIDEEHKSKNPESFLEWYEEHAEGELAKIDAAMGRVLAVLSPSDMDAMLGALSAGPGGETQEAYQRVLDLREPSPSGGYICPVDLTPDDWFLDLDSDQDPTGLRPDPQFIAATIVARRQAIQASISQIQALLDRVPKQGDLQKAVDDLKAARSDYTKAQSSLLDNYADNTVMAVQMFVKGATGLTGAAALAELTKNAVAASKAIGEQPPASATTKSGTAITVDDVTKLTDRQKDLDDAQNKLLSSAQAVSDAGMDLVSAQARNFGDLPVLLARLQSQLADVQTLQSQLADATTAASAKGMPPQLAVVDDIIGAAAKTICDTVSGSKTP